MTTTPAVASSSVPTQSDCGFLGPGPTVSESDLRAAVAAAAVAERDNWFNPAGAIDEQEPSQMGHLIRYWLASKGGILPSTLTLAQANAMDPVKHSPLLNPSVTPDEIASVRDALLGVDCSDPAVDCPTELTTPMCEALFGAHRSGQGDSDYPWSAVFVVSCIRGTAIALGLEADSGGVHEGRDALLMADVGHRVYVQEAYKRRFGTPPRDGTYHAFCLDDDACPDECPPLTASITVQNRDLNAAPVKMGDIIVQDRTPTKIVDISEVDDFCDIPTEEFLVSNPLHCDIVVEVNSSGVVTIGGNLQGGDDCPASSKFSVRRRRYPLNPDGTLLVDPKKLFTQEYDNGDLPHFPADVPASPVDSKSSGRIFALLSLVPRCETP